MFLYSWWRHQIETLSALLALCAGNSPVASEFPSQKPVTRSFDVFFDLHLNKRLSKQSLSWWFETTSCPLWRHCNVLQSKDWTCYHELPLYVLYIYIFDRRYPAGVFQASKSITHYREIIMGAIGSQITSVAIVYSAVCSGADQRKYLSSVSLAFVGEFTGDRRILRAKGQ